MDSNFSQKIQSTLFFHVSFRPKINLQSTCRSLKWHQFLQRTRLQFCTDVISHCVLGALPILLSRFDH
jgi:hypothetical protein